jgi:hypothetical protein
MRRRVARHASQIQSNTSLRSGKTRTRRTIDRTLMLILAATFALRLWGLTDRLPSPRLADSPMDDTAVDEGDRRAMKYAWPMWWGGTQPLHLNPGTGDWPGLPFYLTLGSQTAYRAYDFTRHPGSTAASFRQRAESEPAGIFLAARLPSVVLGTVSVYLVYLLGLSLVGRVVGLLAAAFLALMPFHIVSSQRISDPNLLSLVFMTAAVLATVRLMRTRAVADSIWAGVWVGLAGASKYVPLVLAAPLSLAHVVRTSDGRPWRGLIVRWRALAAALAAVLVAFFVASPFTTLDAAAKMKDIRSQESLLTSEWAGISALSGTLMAYLGNILPDMMTWGGYVVALLGCVVLWKRGAEGRMAVLIPAFFLAALSTLGQAQTRFVLPMAGVLTVACAASCAWIGERIQERIGSRTDASRANVATVSLACVAGALLVWQLGRGVAMQLERAKPDSRHVAHEWVYRSIGPKEMLALDAYGPVFQRGPTGRRAVAWPFAIARTGAVAGAFHPEWLDGVRYYIVSSEVTRRFEGRDPQYEMERRFYAWIGSHGERIWGSDPHGTFGPKIDVYRLPADISSVAGRDSLWEIVRNSPQDSGRMARWTAELAQDFLFAADLARAEEWARRGLAIGQTERRSDLFETLMLAELQAGRFDEAESTAGIAIQQYPSSGMFHFVRAMALEGTGKPRDALVEYRDAHSLTTKEDARRFMEAAISRLERSP